MIMVVFMPFRYGVCESSARCALMDQQHEGPRAVPTIDDAHPEADMGVEINLQVSST